MFDSGPLPELCITFHLHYISFALHLKIMPRQHEMQDTSRFKSLLQPVFRVFEQLLPCQVAILQHLRDVAKALRKLKQ